MTLKKWFPLEIKGERMQEIAIWINKWGSEEKYVHLINNKEEQKIYRIGYKQAINDIYEKLRLKYKIVKIKDITQSKIRNDFDGTYSNKHKNNLYFKTRKSRDTTTKHCRIEVQK